MKFLQRINFYALAFVAFAGVALWFGAKRGLSPQELVAFATGAVALAAQFEKLFRKGAP